MARMLTEAQIGTLEQRLRKRREELLKEIHEELVRTEDERYIDLAGRVHDIGEEAVADLLLDVNLAVLDNQINEVRDIEAALERIRTGTYGICTDCGGPIDFERLEAWPTAKRCRPCQQRYEQTCATGTTPTL